MIEINIVIRILMRGLPVAYQPGRRRQQNFGPGIASGNLAFLQFWQGAVIVIFHGLAISYHFKSI